MPPTHGVINVLGHPSGPARPLLLSSLFGALLWLILWLHPLLGGGDMGLISRLLLLAILVLVPMALVLLAEPHRAGGFPIAHQATVIAYPVAAALVVVSFLLPAGNLAALLASAWLLLTAVVAIDSLTRLLERGVARIEELCVQAGQVYLLVGGIWLVLSRLGANPHGFGDMTVLLTAAHFHYAGFLAPIYAGLVGRAWRSASSRWTVTFDPLVPGIVFGPALVGLGITFSPVVELFGAMLLVASLAGLSLFVLACVVRHGARQAASILLSVSVISLAVAMGLAATYSFGRYTSVSLLTIPQMIWLHGILNGFGFGLCGMVAWLLLRPAVKLSPRGIPFSRLTGPRRIGPSFFERSNLATRMTAQPRGLVDNLEEYRRPGFDPARIDLAVRAFYEETALHSLVVRARWQRGFRRAARVHKVLSVALGQMNLPAHGETFGQEVESRIVALNELRDGRPKVRGWVRTYKATGRAVYVAAYANHSLGAQVYMNIAFPLPASNLTSILRLEELPAGNGGCGIVLTTKPQPTETGDEGVYLVTHWLPVRLPFNETICVWPAQGVGPPEELKELAVEGATALARHDIWLFGVKCLTLDYAIAPASGG